MLKLNLCACYTYANTVAIILHPSRGYEGQNGYWVPFSAGLKGDHHDDRMGHLENQVTLHNIVSLMFSSLASKDVHSLCTQNQRVTTLTLLVVGHVGQFSGSREGARN